MKAYRQTNAERAKAYRDINKSKLRCTKLKRLYGITLEEYNILLEAQNSKCAICKINASEFKKDLAVDHCHTTGAVRGLLCTKCNPGLGYFQDSTELLKAAIEYLND